MKNILLVFTVILSQFVQAQLLNGPMLGYTEMREVAIWIQTQEESTVWIEYKAQDSSTILKTAKYKTKKKEGFTATLVADEVLPGTTYTYMIYMDGEKQHVDVKTEFTTQPIWRWRNDAPDFSFIIGSCAYINEKKFDRPGTPYGGDYQIFENIAKEEAEFMLWLGDNIYLREPDWFTQTGINHRYTHFRSVPETKNLWANMHHYAIWDDHDFGPNNADYSFIHKDKTLTAFQNFWANPSYGLPDLKGGITTFFEYLDMHFFLLDNRYYRTPQFESEQHRHIVGKEQLEWLISALKYSSAPFKFVALGGQVLNTAAKYENHENFPTEKQYLLQRLKEEKINGVIFLDGDRHHSEISKLDDSDGLLLYDITCSPLTSRAVKEVKENNELLIKESMINERNYAVIKVTGERKNRQLTITFKDSNGKELYSYPISEQEW